MNVWKKSPTSMLHMLQRSVLLFITLKRENFKNANEGKTDYFLYNK